MRVVWVFLAVSLYGGVGWAQSPDQIGQTDFSQIQKAEKAEIARQIEAFDKLPLYQRKKLIKESEEQVALAEKAFQEKRYQEALKHYGRSIDLHPKSSTSVYRQAISAYKNGDTKWAITYLNLAESKEIDETEKAYFLALSYYDMKDYEKAIAQFASVKASGDKDLAPSAAYYNGFYQFQQKNYALAKAEFQYVLDTSRDPRMDDKAEKYIELIIRLLQKQKKDQKKFFLSGFLGLQYDSNILFVPDSAADQGVALNEGGGRLVSVGEARWRFLNKGAHELSVKTNLVYLLSFEKDFHRADPLLGGFELPYSFKSKLFGKSYRLDASPGYEILHLDAQNNGGRENILNSVKLNLNNTLVMSRTWFSSYKLSIRHDDSQISVTEAADDSTAVKTEVATTQTFVLNKDKGRVINGGAKYILNAAEGANNKYYRYDVSSLYTQSLGFWGLSGALSLSFYRLIYTERADKRKDSNVAVNMTLSKSLSRWLTVVLTGGYTDNNSSVTANTYDKFSVMLGASAKHSF